MYFGLDVFARGSSSRTHSKFNVSTTGSALSASTSASFYNTSKDRVRGDC